MRKPLMIAAMAAVLAACGGTDYQGGSSMTTIPPVSEATTPPETTESMQTIESMQTAAERRQCEKYAQGLKRAKRHLAKLKHDGPMAPVDGYDFTEDYSREVFETEQEVEFYADAMSNPPCVPDEDPYAGQDYDPSEDPGFDPNPYP